MSHLWERENEEKKRREVGEKKGIEKEWKEGKMEGIKKDGSKDKKKEF